MWVGGSSSSSSTSSQSSRTALLRNARTTSQDALGVFLCVIPHGAAPRLWGRARPYLLIFFVIVVLFRLLQVVCVWACLFYSAYSLLVGVSRPRMAE